MSWRGVGSWACERLQKRARAPGLGQGPPPPASPTRARPVLPSDAPAPGMQGGSDRLTRVHPHKGSALKGDLRGPGE